MGRKKLLYWFDNYSYYLLIPIILLSSYFYYDYNIDYYNEAVCNVTEPSKIEMWKTTTYTVNYKDLNKTIPVCYKEPLKLLHFCSKRQIELNKSIDESRYQIVCWEE